MEEPSDSYVLDNQIWLLIMLILFLILPIPITLFPSSSHLIFALIYSLLVASGIKTLIHNRRHLIIGVSLGLISFVLIWSSLLTTVELGTLVLIKEVSLLLFFSFLAGQLFHKIAINQTVDLNVIYASISGYLIIGIIGGLLFQTLELAMPGSFGELSQNNGLYDLHYLSFVTLTTLGFGDITPASEAAKSITLILGIAGQLYLTILIAILVGKYLSNSNS